MVTKFDVGDEVLVLGKVKGIRIDNSAIALYDIEIYDGDTDCQTVQAVERHILPLPEENINGDN